MNTFTSPSNRHAKEKLAKVRSVNPFQSKRITVVVLKSIIHFSSKSIPDAFKNVHFSKIA